MKNSKKKIAMIALISVGTIYYVLNYTNLGFALGMGWPF